MASLPPGEFASGRWLVVGTGELAVEMATRLTGPAQACRVVPHGLTPNQYAAAFDELGERWQGVVVLPPPGPTAGQDPTPDELAEQARVGVSTVLGVVQARLAASAATAARVWLTTVGGVGWPGSGPVAAGHALLWGLGRTLALEHPEAWGGMTDLDPTAPPADQVANLLSHLSDDTAEDQIAWRAGTRLAPRLVRAAIAAGSAPALSGLGSYLVTGGLGALGLKVAEWMVARGARHVVLAGRTGAATVEQQAAITRLRAGGADVVIVRADVGTAEGAAAAVAAAGPGLRGVVHAAGTADGGTLGRLQWEEAQGVLTGKAIGAWRLDWLTRDRPLDFFVLFSSLVSVLGGPGQGAYAAANAALDGLAWTRREAGRPAVSIGWGPWDAGGMATDLIRSWLSQRGVHGLSDEVSLKAFSQCLDGSQVQRVVAMVDWHLFRPLFEVRRPGGLLSRLIALDSNVPISHASTPAGGWLRRELERLPAAERLAQLLAHVRATTSRALGLSGPVDPDRGFTDQGLDSLLAIGLRDALRTDLGTAIPATAPFDHPTPRKLAAFLAHLLGWERDLSSLTSRPSGECASDIEQISKLTDWELMTEIATKFNSK